MNLLYISTSCPMNKIEILNKKFKKKLQVSSNKYHNALIDGLLDNGISICSIYALPINHSISTKLLWKSEKMNYNNCRYFQLGFINLSFFKYISINYNLNRIIKKILKENYGEKNVILFDGAFVSIYPTLKKYVKQIPTYAIIADVYEYMADVDNSSKYKKVVVNNVKKFIKSVNKYLTGYIFLNENMNKLYKSNNYIIIEGIVSNFNNVIRKRKNNNEKKIILYAGGLLEKFGIKNLIEAFKLIYDSSYELHLYGYTDIEDYILNNTKSDCRIKYFGMKDTETVFLAEKNATILVNPRPTCYEFQKYSFPSKIIEYMCSGTPVITTKIDGMPKEYDDYLFYFDDYSVDGLKQKIEEVLKYDSAIIEKKGIDAFNFVYKEKSAYVQAKKIIEFID